MNVQIAAQFHGTNVVYVVPMKDGRKAVEILKSNDIEAVAPPCEIDEPVTHYLDRHPEFDELFVMIRAY